MKDRVSAFLREYDLLQADGRILTGVSGGADSMCLLLLLKEAEKDGGPQIFAVHVNHGIRGAEADADEAFVREVCERQGVPLTVIREDIPRLAAERGTTLEETGRDVRLEVFRAEALRLGCAAVAVAHHRDDAAETVLMNILRGCGPEGLAGLRPSRPLSAADPEGPKLIRPLLDVTKREILDWMRARGEAWREDATNAEPDADRNRIRLEVLPLLESIRPGAAGRVAGLAERAAELTGLTDRLAAGVLAQAKRAAGAQARVAGPVTGGESETPGTAGAPGIFGNVVPAAVLGTEPLREADPALLPYVLRLALAEARGTLKDVTAVHLEALKNLVRRETDAEADLPGIIAARKGDLLLFYPCAARTGAGNDPAGEASDGEAADGESAKACGEDMAPLPQLEYSVREIAPGEKYPENPYTKWFDYDKITQNIVIRRRLPGDFLEVNGGTKLLRRWFIDEKVPAGARAGVPLLADGSHIMWIVGGRMSDHYKVGPNTRRILEARLTEREPAPGPVPEALSPSVKEQ